MSETEGNPRICSRTRIQDSSLLDEMILCDPVRMHGINFERQREREREREREDVGAYVCEVCVRACV